jgi:GT2 family glycosyltransferase
MDLSIIIVNWNTRDLLRNCLRSIKASSGAAGFETIVVDNNSSDGSREMVASEFPQVKLLNSGANLGFAKANNIGLQHATAPLVLYLNPDTEVRRETLSQMMKFMHENKGIGALGCKIRNLSGTLQQLGLQWFPTPLTELVKFLVVSESTHKRCPGLLPFHDAERSGEVIKLFGACLLVRRAVLDQVGAFDERFFMYCEDVDLCYRISRAGWRLYYLAEAEILHLGGASGASAPSSFSVLMMCESFSKYMDKQYGFGGAFAYRIAALIGAQARLCALLIIRLAGYARLRLRDSALEASFRKYLAVTKWSLGIQKALVRN